jgi:hypothetical protein
MRLNRNKIFGIVNIVIGGIFLTISGMSVVAVAAFSSDIPQELCDSTGCVPMEDVAMDAVIVTGIIGGIVSSIGIFLFLYGMKQDRAKASRPAT